MIQLMDKYSENGDMKIFMIKYAKKVKMLETWSNDFCSMYNNK